jgi:nucleotide-binding universal stress UspA family protein
MLARSNVVVGYDGSDSSLGAVAHGAWEARRLGVPLKLLLAYRASAPYGLMGLAPDPSFVEEELIGLRSQLADRQREVQQAYPQLEVTADLVVGSPGGVLVDASRTAAMVVVGCRGLGGFTGLLLGSASEQLAAHSHAPVVVIRPPGASAALGSEPPHEPIVVGVDGVPESQAAMRFAFEEAAARGVPLVALYAWWMSPVSSLSPEDGRRYDLVAAEDEARRLLAEAVSGWQGEYPDVKVELRPAQAINPTVALLEESEHAGLLVVSRHGGNALTRLLFGSIGDIAVRRAACPVAVVPEQ